MFLSIKKETLNKVAYVIHDLLNQKEGLTYILYVSPFFIYIVTDFFIKLHGLRGYTR